MANMKKQAPVGYPTSEELEPLPRWARVAFAARCARRVQPLFKAAWPDAPQEHLIALDEAIMLAERSAANAATDAASARVAFTTINAADEASSAAQYATAYAAQNAYVARAAAYAARAAVLASIPTSVRGAPTAIATAEDFDDLMMHNSHVAFARATDAAPTLGVAHAALDAAHATNAAYVAVSDDFDLLAMAAREEKWTDDTPVSPEFFGPLWPNGAPEGWPVQEEESGDSELVIEIDVPEGVDDDEAVARAVELVDSLDDLHCAYGGDGLKIEGIEVMVDAPVREGVPT